MLLEEVLADHRKGRKIKRRDWGQNIHFGIYSSVSSYDIDADDWELVPESLVVIDLVEYADGYEFVFGKENGNCSEICDGTFKGFYNSAQKILGGVYMTKEKTRQLVDKLNSGEWVLK